MGLPVCLRTASGFLADVLIFNCARPAAEFECAWAPLVEVAAEVLVMSGSCRSEERVVYGRNGGGLRERVGEKEQSGAREEVETPSACLRWTRRTVGRRGVGVDRSG